MITLFALFFLHNGHFGYVEERAWHDLYKQGLCKDVYITSSPFVPNQEEGKKTGNVMVCELP